MKLKLKPNPNNSKHNKSFNNNNSSMTGNQYFQHFQNLGLTYQSQDNYYNVLNRGCNQNSNPNLNSNIFNRDINNIFQPQNFQSVGVHPTPINYMNNFNSMSYPYLQAGNNNYNRSSNYSQNSFYQRRGGNRELYSSSDFIYKQQQTFIDKNTSNSQN